MSYSFTIEGAPRGKERPRFGQGRSYTPSKTKNYEKLVRWSFRTQCPDALYAVRGVPVRVVITAVFPVPKGVSKAKRARMLAGEVLPLKKPDWDNVGKIVCDALNGLAWEDDSQIVCGLVRKMYGASPEVRVCVLVGEEVAK